MGFWNAHAYTLVQALQKTRNQELVLTLLILQRISSWRVQSFISFLKFFLPEVPPRTRTGELVSLIMRLCYCRLQRVLLPTSDWRRLGYKYEVWDQREKLREESDFRPYTCGRELELLTFEDTSWARAGCI